MPGEPWPRWVRRDGFVDLPGDDGLPAIHVEQGVRAGGIPVDGFPDGPRWARFGQSNSMKSLLLWYYLILHNENQEHQCH